MNTAASTLLTRPGHQPTVTSVGWGEPPTYYTKCTCGWAGITIHTPYYPNAEAEADAMIEPYRTIARTYGPEIMLNDNSAYGTQDDAIRQALAHVGYDPDTDRATVLTALTTATTDLHHLLATSPTIDATHQTGRAVRKALADVSAANTRLKAWGDGTLPTLPHRHPEGRRLIAAHQAATRTTK